MSSRRMSVVLAVFVVASVLVVDFASLSAEAPPINALAHHLKRGFRNADPTYSYSMSGRAARLLAGTFEGSPARGTPPAVLANDGGELARTATCRRSAGSDTRPSSSSSAASTS